MARNNFLGTAPAVAQVDTFTPATIEATDIFTLTVTGFDGSSASVDYTAVDTSATTVSGAIINLWNAETRALFTGITASGTSTVILTADTAGVAFKVASTAVDGGGADTQTFTRAATTKNEGPNDFSSTGNWSEGTIPGATGSEDTWIENSSIDILYGLDQAGGTALVSLHIPRTYTGKIGHNGATGLVGDHLRIDTAKAFTGEHFISVTAQGSGRIKLDFGTVTTQIINYFMATSADSPKPALRIICNDVSTTLKEHRKGSVGIASGSGETATLASAAISYATNIGADATLEIGPGVTITTIAAIGGETTVGCAATTITSKAGTMVTHGSGAITTLTVDGGNVTPTSTGTITTCTAASGTVDFTQSAEARTVTNLTISPLANVLVDLNSVTLTNDIKTLAADGRVALRASQG